jgi:thymidylate synthase
MKTTHLEISLVYHDQLKNIIERAKKNPLDRRLIVSAWRPDELDEMALPPCHYAWQILSDGKYLDLIWIQRSIDTFLGLPYNIASYGLLLMLLGLELDLTPRRLVGQLADTHLYENHMEQVKLQLDREPLGLPSLDIMNFTNIFDWKYTDVKLNNYVSHPSIKAEIAI